MIDYPKRLVEVDEILKHLSSEYYQKIPEEVKTIIKENKDKQYIWKYDETKKLKEQNVHADTIAIVSYINSTYLLNEEQKEFINKIHEINNSKEVNYFKNTEDLFNSTKINEISMVNIEENKKSMMYKIKQIIKQIILKFKKKINI